MNRLHKDFHILALALNRTHKNTHTVICTHSSGPKPVYKVREYKSHVFLRPLYFVHSFINSFFSSSWSFKFLDGMGNANTVQWVTCPTRYSPGHQYKGWETGSSSRFIKMFLDPPPWYRTGSNQATHRPLCTVPSQKVPSLWCLSTFFMQLKTWQYCI